MDRELGTDPALLWKLLLAQIVYDESGNHKKPLDYARVAQVYSNHPLVPHDAPSLETGSEAEIVFQELLKEHEIPLENDTHTLSALLAEPLYISFHKNLLDKMQADVSQFETVYRQLEEVSNFPVDERLAEAEQ